MSHLVNENSVESPLSPDKDKDKDTEMTESNNGANLNSALKKARLGLRTGSSLNLDAQSVGYSQLQQLADNPKPQESSAPSFSLAGTSGDSFVLVMVGLPARGKTYTARKLRQYLKFFHGAPCEVFNVGNYRRKAVGAHSTHTFFDNANAEYVSIRQECAQHAMDDLKKWMLEGLEEQKGEDLPVGKVGIYDATNTNRERRDWIKKELAGTLQSPRHLIFVESICTDNEIVETNLHETKLKMPDYEGKDEAFAIDDFEQRIAHYASVYETLGEDEGSWIKITDAGRMITTNNIFGFLPGRIVQFLMNLHINPRPIYLSRHGESEYNEQGKIGGDSSLNKEGEEYAKELAKFVHTVILGLNEDGTFKDPEKRVATHARLFTSSLKRTKETAKHIKHPVCSDGWVVMRPKVWRAIDEIYAGVFDGMTYEEIKEAAPDEFEARHKDKMNYRYPRGESYVDVIQRLDAVMLEIHRQRDPVLIIGHQGILRIIYSYLMGLDREEAPYVPIPLNTVIKLTPGTYSCEENRAVLLQPPDKDTPSH